MRALLALTLAVLITGCATIVPGPAVPAVGGGPPPYAAWGDVLSRYVDASGRVDFRAAARQRAGLDEFVAWVYAHSPKSAPERFRTPAEVLAFHLNAYNALSLYNVIESGFPKTLAGAAKIEFFLLRKVKVGGEAISLYAYENDVIRKLGEPRIHFALNCMSVGCPNLPREPFLPERLEAQLMRETRAFLNDPRHVRMDAAEKTVWLSEIFDFFTADFLAVAPSLIAYVNRYRDEPLPADYRVRFIPYDWTVKAQR
jgi:hypothetical protein